MFKSIISETSSPSWAIDLCWMASRFPALPRLPPSGLIPLMFDVDPSNADLLRASVYPPQYSITEALRLLM